MDTYKTPLINKGRKINTGALGTPYLAKKTGKKRAKTRYPKYASNGTRKNT
jgi:hypothetical protein